MILPLFKVVGGAVAHFCSTISAVDHTGKQTALARLCPAMPLLANLLHLVKDFLLNDRRVGIVENRLFFNRRFPLLLVPDGIGVGLEVDRTACVFPPFQNVNNRVGVPMVPCCCSSPLPSPAFCQRHIGQSRNTITVSFIWRFCLCSFATACSALLLPSGYTRTAF